MSSNITKANQLVIYLQSLNRFTNDGDFDLQQANERMATMQNRKNAIRMEKIHPKLRLQIDTLFVKCSSKISAKEESVQRAMQRDVQKLPLEDDDQWELVMMPGDSDDEFPTTTSTHHILETAKTVEDVVTFPKSLPNTNRKN